MVEYGCKTEEKVKAMKSEIKENVQGTNSDRKETRTQINGLEQKEERNSQPDQPEWCTKTKKYGPSERTEQNSRKRAK